MDAARGGAGGGGIVKDRDHLNGHTSLRRKAPGEREAFLCGIGTSPAAESEVVLSPEASRRFLDALGRPFRPNDRLKKAMEEAEGLLKPRYV